MQSESGELRDLAAANIKNGVHACSEGAGIRLFQLPVALRINDLTLPL
jgi:hypothetical protein